MGALFAAAASSAWTFAKSPFGRGLIATLVAVLAVLALLFAVHHHGFEAGVAHEKAAQAARVAKERKAVVKREAAADRITQDVGTKAETRQAQIRWRTQTLIREVPVYVTPETDRRFAVPVGLVRLHDAAALGVDPATLPDPAGRPDDAASGVAPSTLGATLAGNYGTCLAELDRFRMLQSWIEQQQAAWARPD